MGTSKINHKLALRFKSSGPPNIHIKSETYTCTQQQRALDTGLLQSRHTGIFTGTFHKCYCLFCQQWLIDENIKCNECHCVQHLINPS